MPAPADSVYRAMTCGEWRMLKRASPLALRVFLELFYGDDSERAGVVVVRPSVLCDELGSSKRAVLKALAELVSIGAIEHDENASVAGRVGFIPANLPAQRNNAKGWLDSLPKGRDSFIVEQAIDFIEPRVSRREAHGGIRREAHGDEHGGAPSDSPQVHRSTGPQDHNSLTLAPPAAPKQRAKKAAFEPPTVEQVAEAFAAKGMTKPIAEREADKFVGYYASKGWLVGKAKMKDWKAATRTWFRNWQERNPVEARVQTRPAVTVAPGGVSDPYR